MFLSFLMENINEDDLKVLEHAVVYFYVDWSVYAMQGLRMFEQLESSWPEARFSGYLSFSRRKRRQCTGRFHVRMVKTPGASRSKVV